METCAEVKSVRYEKVRKSDSCIFKNLGRVLKGRKDFKERQGYTEQKEGDNKGTMELNKTARWSLEGCL